MDHLEPYRSVPGTRVCMKCGKEFESPDRMRIRRCPVCKRSEGSSGPNIYSCRHRDAGNNAGGDN